MPSATFFNLPEGKREKLLRAAQEEFSRSPYDQASVNKIIRGAGIPRGSFYMYFTDKEDLFHYLLSTHGEQIKTLVQCLLKQHGGELFGALLSVFDYIAGGLEQGPPDGACHSIMQIMRCNGQIRPDLIIVHGVPGRMETWVNGHVDTTGLDLRDPEDFSLMLQVLVSVTGGALGEVANGRDAAQARRTLARTFEILRRGMQCKSPAV